MAQTNRPVRDNMYLGAFLGLVFPALGFLLYWLVFFSDSMTVRGFWNFLFASRNISGALSLSIIMNLAIFFYGLSNNKYETVKGVVAATIFYGILIIMFKFL